MAKIHDQFPESLSLAFMLRIHSHLLTLLLDSHFMVGYTGYLKRRMKKDSPSGIIYRPLEQGAAHVIAERAIDHWFENIENYGSEGDISGYYDSINLLDTLTGVYINFEHNNKFLDDLSSKCWDLSMRAYGTNDVEAWLDLHMDEGIDALIEFANKYRSSRFYSHMRRTYANALADRILHDRQVCGYLSGNLLQLAPTSRKNKYGLSKRKSFVSRVKWPSFVSRIVIARDRGKCAYCKIDISSELLANPHIDHIFPLSDGGCNDVVNLQLCCETCNLKKGSRRKAIEPSTPGYFGGNYIFDIDDEFM